MRNKLSVTLVGLFACVALLPSIFPVHAQQNETDFGVAYPIMVELEENQEIENGMIVSHRNGAYRLSGEAYDRNIIGAVNLFPAIEFVGDLQNAPEETPVISAGSTPVLVSGENGPIEMGNYIVASSVPGVGMRATKSGFTLGVALESFDGATADERTLINVRIGKDFTFGEDTPDSETISNRLRDVVSLSAIAAIDDPREMLKYLVAGIILISSVIISFVSFSRTSQKGIEALGRNPLARSSIMTGIFVNILVSITIISAGVAGAYFVVTL